MKHYKDLQVGDIVTGYKAGLHRITKIDTIPGLSSNGLTVLEQICTSNMKRRRGKSECDIPYCQLVTNEMLDGWVAEHQKQIDAINRFRKEFIGP
jgi:hypothetical protein